MHTFIILISNEPALGINEPINQGLLMNTAQNKTHAVSLSFYARQIHQWQAHILSHQKLSISHSGRRLVCHFLLPHREQNQEVCERLRPRMQPESPFISVKTRGFLRPCSHPGHPHLLLRPPGPPAPVAAYLRLLIRGYRDHKPGQKTWKPGERTIAKMQSQLFHTTQSAKKYSVPFQTHSKKSLPRLSPGMNGPFFVLCTSLSSTELEIGLRSTA